MSLEREDYMMRQIVQLGQALARMISRLLNIKQAPEAGLSLDDIKLIYQDELDLNLDLVQQTSAEDLIELLKTDFKFIEQHLGQMAEILSETADIFENNPEIKDKEAGVAQAKELRKKSIIILEHLQESSGVYSFERMARITQLKELI